MSLRIFLFSIVCIISLSYSGSKAHGEDSDYTTVTGVIEPLDMSSNAENNPNKDEKVIRYHNEIKSAPIRRFSGEHEKNRKTGSFLKNIAPPKQADELENIQPSKLKTFGATAVVALAATVFLRAAHHKNIPRMQDLPLEQSESRSGKCVFDLNWFDKLSVYLCRSIGLFEYEQENSHQIDEEIDD